MGDASPPGSGGASAGDAPLAHTIHETMPATIVMAPTDLPATVAGRGAQTVRDVYHCAVPMAAQHISNGMYGLILVEPEGGLPPVDHEFYVMQGELYTEEAFGQKGELTESFDKLMNELPEYYVFNGAANALSGDNALHAKVGETVRIYFGVGGPNKTSSFL